MEVNQMLARIILTGFGIVAVAPLADAAAPTARGAVVPARAAVPSFHAAGVAGPAFIGGPAKQQTGILTGKPGFRHH